MSIKHLSASSSPDEICAALNDDGCVVVDNVVAPADYLDWAKMNTTFESTDGYVSMTVDLTGDGEPTRLVAGVGADEVVVVADARGSCVRCSVGDEDETDVDEAELFEDSKVTN